MLALVLDLMPTLVFLLGLLAMVLDLMLTLVFLLGLLAMVLDLMLTLAFLLGLLAMVLDLMLTLAFLLGFLGLLDLLGPDLSQADSRERGYFCQDQSHASDVPPWMCFDPKRRRLGTGAGSSCDHPSCRNPVITVRTPLLANHVTLLLARVLSLL